MPSNIFITGTDTAIGKTWVTLGVMAAFQSVGISVVGMKPVASGCRPTEQGLRNEDAEQLLNQSSVPVAYDLVNPFAFEPAIAPHIAAAEVGCKISLSKIESCYQALTERAECCIVEGVGGWLVPLTPTQTVADLVRHLGLSVILVVGIRLGCINHALLSVESIQRGGNELLGWVANHSESEVERSEENILTLEERIDAPLLARIPWFTKPTVPDFASRMMPITDQASG
uniref:ATP-dependent dethiobiotin synthetase BioD n=1 Tax=Candidatus Kentrum sp. TUN TaxID=2126343 RepID=A0A450ZIN0_9GAMM|nr:MAG: dethiobiotin synthetase [Candidatus Kentron sp. TUN]VFK53568.1 MAG: dethiobiotin synthetase [Candidatus Kentron sp. TUN]VFK55016.1 MAG: dethiobiotin synthetase [Candidatus Kentron sp. TUN]